MKDNRLLAICFLSSFLLPFLTIQAQMPESPFSRSTISGFIFDSERRPISDIQVELMNDFNSVLQRTKTNGSGRFFFRGVSQGRFQIRVLPLGTNFEEQTQEVEIYGVGASGRQLMDHVQKDFYLRVRRSSTSTSAVPGAIFVQEVPEEAKTIYQKAVTDFDGGRVEAAVAGLENALKLYPTYYLALEKLGLIYTGQQKYEKALDVFGKVVAVNSRSFNGWYGLSYVNYALKQWAAAVEAAQRAVSLSSNSEDALLFLGLSLRQARRYEEAEKSLKQADKITKGASADVHWNLALLYAHNLKRYKDAANELELYLKTNPGIPNADSIKKLIKQYRENPPSN
jgi:tetratricopeptide (TPR) repeat protein